MDIKASLEAEHSKDQTMRIAGYIGFDEDRFAELMHLFLGKEKVISQRAGWVLSYCAEAYPHLVVPYIKAMLDNLERTDIHDAVKRNTLRTLAEQQLDEELMGQAATLAFNFLEDPKEPIAIKVFSMEIIAQMCKVEPGLAGELRLYIEDQMPHGSAGFRARGKRILKNLPKEESDW